MAYWNVRRAVDDTPAGGRSAWFHGGNNGILVTRRPLGDFYLVPATPQRLLGSPQPHAIPRKNTLLIPLRCSTESCKRHARASSPATRFRHLPSNELTSWTGFRDRHRSRATALAAASFVAQEQEFKVKTLNEEPRHGSIDVRSAIIRGKNFELDETNRVSTSRMRVRWVKEDRRRRACVVHRVRPSNAYKRAGHDGLWKNKKMRNKSVRVSLRGNRVSTFVKYTWTWLISEKTGPNSRQEMVVEISRNWGYNFS